MGELSYEDYKNLEYINKKTKSELCPYCEYRSRTNTCYSNPLEHCTQYGTEFLRKYYSK